MKTVGIKDLVEHIAERTSHNAGDIRRMLSELCAAVIFFAKRGFEVKLEGRGTYSSEIDTQGKISITHQLKTEIKNALNVPSAYFAETIRIFSLFLA